LRQLPGRSSDHPQIRAKQIGRGVNLARFFAGTHSRQGGSRSEEKNPLGGYEGQVGGRGGTVRGKEENGLTGKNGEWLKKSRERGYGRPQPFRLSLKVLKEKHPQEILKGEKKTGFESCPKWKQKIARKLLFHGRGLQVTKKRIRGQIEPPVKVARPLCREGGKGARVVS